VSGTFSSLNTALSALRYTRVAMDVASGNIANVGTDG
jgi:flagellar hook-associated protein 1 FlgK